MSDIWWVKLWHPKICHWSMMVVASLVLWHSKSSHVWWTVWMRICTSAAFLHFWPVPFVISPRTTSKTFKSSVLQILLIDGVRHGTRTAMKMTLLSFQGVERTSKVKCEDHVVLVNCSGVLSLLLVCSSNSLRCCFSYGLKHVRLNQREMNKAYMFDKWYATRCYGGVAWPKMTMRMGFSWWPTVIFCGFPFSHHFQDQISTLR